MATLSAAAPPVKPKIVIPKGKRLLDGRFLINAQWKDWHFFLYQFGTTKGEEKLGWFKRLDAEFWPEPVSIWSRWDDLFYGALCGAKETVERVAGVTLEADYPWWEQLTSTGAAGTGKSSRAAKWILCNWLCAREHTTCMLTSTSVTALKQRIWSELIDWIEKSKKPISGPPDQWLQIVPSDTIIRWSERDTKSAIFGRAVDQGGSVDNAVGRIKGIHNRRVFVVTDEMTAMPEAIAKACRNLDSGTMEFQFIGLGNATERTDQHGLYCEPKDGWNSVGVEDEFWLTKLGGCCVHLDGHKSPALEEPDRFHFYIGRKKLEKDARFFGGENTPDYWRECRGFWAPSGLSNTVMDEPMLIQFEAEKPAVWKNGFQMGAGFDVAFEGEDRAVLYPFKFGEFTSGAMGMELQAPIIVAGDSSQDERWLPYSIADNVQKVCEGYTINEVKHPIRPENFMEDTTGEGGNFHAILSARWSPKIRGVEFGEAPDKTLINSALPETWYERYGKKNSQIWFLFRAYVEGGQVRGLTDPETRKELCARKREMKNGKIIVEPKTKMKGRSPDKAEAACIAAYMLFERGLLPAGVTASVPAANIQEWNEKAARVNIDDEEAYGDWMAG